MKDSKSEEGKKTVWDRFTSLVSKTLSFLGKYTGISWVLGGISSVLKSVFGSKGAGKEGAATPESKAPQNYGAGRADGVARPKGDGIEAVSQAKFSSDENSLLLIITEQRYRDLKNNYQNKDNKEEFCAFVQCDGENLRITGFYETQKDVSDGKKAISVTSVKNEKASEAYVKKELSEMKTKVGLDDNRRFIEITKMSPEPFNPVVSSHKSAPAAEKVSAVVKPEGNGKGHEKKVSVSNSASADDAAKPDGKTPESPKGNGKGHENGSRTVEQQSETPKVSEKGGQVNDGNTETGAKPPVKPQGNVHKAQNPEDAAKGKIVYGFIQIVKEETFSVEVGSTFNDRLILKLPKKEDLANYSKKQGKSGKYSAYVECDEKAYQITVKDVRISTLQGLDEQWREWNVFSIDSVKPQDAEDVSCELKRMKEILNWNDSKETIMVTKISPNPIELGVESSESVPVVKKGSEEFSGKIVPSKHLSVLELHLTHKNYKKLQGCKNPAKPEEFCVLMECANGKFHITGNYGSKRTLHGSIIAIDSVTDKDGETVRYTEKEGMQKIQEMLGLVGTEEIEVTSISKAQVAPKVSSSESAAPKLSEAKKPENRSKPVKPTKKPKTPQKSRQAGGGSSESSNGNQEKFVGSIKVEGDNLKLVVPKKKVFFIENNSNLLYVQCGNNVLRITCNGGYHMSDGDGECFSINSVAMKDGASVSSKLGEMRDKLGLKETTTEVNVTIMSPKKATEATSTANGSQPNPSVTNTDPKQQFVFGRRLTL
ncbi:hypothetical protein [Wolbachia endosymbiont of Folsomia candida]|uniref:hypothetical protein n=1 Tax=Wolbachia endosymbiont of Folsomia candida TaxID=169402 RepID=UPI000AD5849D|nr:hypothetical protein [Wolbachia endosymbiont of Folsomia candida]APR97931.1 hypothetical protein ASM33_01195 [Wolbachia endosymbiont of Folsomia candida]